MKLIKILKEQLFLLYFGWRPTDNPKWRKSSKQTPKYLWQKAFNEPINYSKRWGKKKVIRRDIWYSLVRSEAVLMECRQQDRPDVEDA